jgi:hypothetical protein
MDQFDEIYREFSDSVNGLIRSNINMQYSIKGSRSYMNKIRYLEEYATISINSCRRIGKTRYITSVLDEEPDEESLVIVKDRSFKWELYNDRTNVIAANQVAPYVFKNYNPKFIFVDEPFLVFNIITKENLYETFMRDYINCFVFLGN